MSEEISHNQEYSKLIRKVAQDILNIARARAEIRERQKQSDEHIGRDVIKSVEQVVHELNTKMVFLDIILGAVTGAEHVLRARSRFERRARLALSFKGEGETIGLVDAAVSEATLAIRLNMGWALMEIYLCCEAERLLVSSCNPIPSLVVFTRRFARYFKSG
jgi:hypothetical protein